MEKITVVLASCNRFELLRKTLDSFFASCNYPIHRFLLTEDSTKQDMKQKILSRYGNRIDFYFNEKNLGPVVTFDNMYNLVDTEYIFHCEDDWEFTGEPNFIPNSLDILQQEKDIHQVWIRTDVPNSWIEPQVFSTQNNTQYRIIKKHHLSEWSGFSFNPGLRRKSDYLKFFPNGFNEFKQDIHIHSEYACNLHVNKFNYKAASLVKPACYHIGYGLSAC